LTNFLYFSMVSIVSILKESGRIAATVIAKCEHLYSSIM